MIRSGQITTSGGIATVGTTCPQLEDLATALGLNYEIFESVTVRGYAISNFGAIQLNSDYYFSWVRYYTTNSALSLFKKSGDTLIEVSNIAWGQPVNTSASTPATAALGFYYSVNDSNREYFVGISTVNSVQGIAFLSCVELETGEKIINCGKMTNTDYIPLFKDTFLSNQQYFMSALNSSSYLNNLVKIPFYFAKDGEIVKAKNMAFSMVTDGSRTGFNVYKVTEVDSDDTYVIRPIAYYHSGASESNPFIAMKES